MVSNKESAGTCFMLHSRKAEKWWEMMAHRLGSSACCSAAALASPTSNRVLSHCAATVPLGGHLRTHTRNLLYCLEVPHAVENWLLHSREGRPRSGEVGRNPIRWR
uniref:Uncharacterized protein n=1 Tax=Arundo donax TaxID=35708 RepID=A0A0A9H1Q1_ARUDO